MKQPLRLNDSAFQVEPSFKDRFLFDMFVDLLKCSNEAAKTAQFLKIAEVTKSIATANPQDYEAVASLLEKYFFFNENAQTRDAIQKDLKDGTAKSAVSITNAHLAARVGLKEEYTDNDVERVKQEFAKHGAFLTGRRELFEMQVVVEGKKTLYSELSEVRERDNQSFSDVFHDQIPILYDYNPSVMIEDGHTIEALVYSGAIWILKNSLKVDIKDSDISQKIQTMKSICTFTSIGVGGMNGETTLSAASKLEILKALNNIKEKPLLISMANQTHFVSAQLVWNKESKSIDLYYFDGDNKLENSFAKDWVEDLKKFIETTSTIQDTHVKVQHANNCGLTSAIASSYRLALQVAGESKAPSLEQVFDDLLGAENKRSDSAAWKAIPAKFMDNLFIGNPTFLLSAHFNYDIPKNSFFSETFKRMELVKDWRFIRNKFVELNPSISADLELKSTTSLSNFSLFIKCLFSDNFFKKELRDYSGFVEKISKLETPKAAEQKFDINNVLDEKLLKILNTPATENSFLSSAACVALVAVLACACLYVYKNNISFTSIVSTLNKGISIG